ncbi:hypothetical protein JCM3770_003185 [Rhodotorula araucariae]
MPPRKKATASKKSVDSDDEGEGPVSREHLDLNLPPIHNIYEVFNDVVRKNADALAELFTKLDRPLRVATMCSGTESPILALKLMLRSLEEQKGVEASVEHVFSAEIEPFKQAYIERNFHPPLLFRDVTELPNEKARTAYGAFATVPQHADMLIAGTSCVDFSTLNNLKKGLTDGGESGRTFFGMYRWVEKARPKVVILENVLKAPWQDMIKNFAEIDYSAEFVSLDTKKYYVPHTRTRGYLVAFPNIKGKKNKEAFFDLKSAAKSAERMAEQWQSKMQSSARAASSPAEAFLLDSDDPRIHRARAELSQKRLTAIQGKQRDATDWARCQQRHSIARTLEKLGPGKPLTGWSAQGGKPTMPDGAWQDWAEAQTERVLDLMDISYLRQARMGVDITYKSAIWNLSQNVDRTTSSKLFGITPCLTPNMIPYLTNRGGPVVGIEALALQGLPIDELLLTRETTDQLADLAGNAMSSTVVGTAILSALLVAGHTFEDKETVQAALELKDADGDDEMVDVAAAAAKVDDEPTNEALEARCRGDERLVEHPVDLASSQPAPADLLERAHRSARMCSCEGPLDVSPHAISTCAGCGHSACAPHQGKPKHRYDASGTVAREKPRQFEHDLKSLLPMRVTVPGFNRAEMGRILERAREKGGSVNGKVIEKYLDIIADALGTAEFHFNHVSRRQYWTAVYGSDKARLELFFAETEMEWRIFVDPPNDLGTLDPLRIPFDQPIARIKVPAGTSDLLAGEWDISIPLAGLETRLEMEYGEMVESWRARLGLDEFKDEKRPATIKMAFQGDVTLLDRQINGTYTLEADCGTATNALYRRTEPAAATPLYFFFDPSPYLETPYDRFVFAETCTRTSGVRPLIASLETSWHLNPTRESGETADRVYTPYEPSRTPKIFITHLWEPLSGAKIVAGGTAVNEASRFSTIKTGLEISVAEGTCSQAETLLMAHVPLEKSPSAVWANETWHNVDLQHEGPEVFSKLGWMLARIPEWQALHDWQTVDTASLPAESCFKCAPNVPNIDWVRRWVLGNGTKNPWRVTITAREDGKQAAAYETSLKNRPAPIIVHTRQVGSDFQFKVAFNAASLSHRVLAQLPSVSPDLTVAVSTPVVSWRLLTDATADLGPSMGVNFTLKSNRPDPEAKNPALFEKFALRTEQLRSLHWMIKQETAPQPWVEEEVAEALLPQLGWRAEAKATREVVVRGGVLADAVGYGKTAITIALIAAQRDKDAKLPEQTDRVPLKATLVVVPKHLFGQWGTEIKKFTGSGLSFIAIDNVNKMKQYTVEDFQAADVVIIAQSILQSDRFWPYTADFAASQVDIKTDKKAGRYFRHCVAETMDALGEQVQRLADEGSKAAFKAVEKARENRFNVSADEEYIPLSRKKANKSDKNANPKFKAPPKPKLGREGAAKIETDPWGLQDKQVRNDWTKLQGPPLAMFLWARVVLDEFSYIDGADLVGFHTCRGRSRWILSGTPPLRDFSEVKSIASLLNVHLGINDDSEGVADAVKTRNSEATMAEKFRSYCDVRTRAWHIRRDQVAQRFLDQYARQNVAEIEDIPLETELVGVRLPGAEMAIYRELEHHLVAVDPSLAKIAKVKAEKQSDRDKRLREALGQSKTPDEALLKRCSHFSLDLDEDEIAGGKAPDVCDFIHDLRERQLQDCKAEVQRHLITTAWLHRACEKERLYDEVTSAKRNFKIWVEKLYGDGFGDAAANECLKELAVAAGVEAGGKMGPIKKKPESKDIREFNVRPDKYSNEEYAVYRVNLVRIAGVTLNKLASELVGRYRSARYFDKVRSILRKDGDDTATAILSCCGHHGKLADVEEAVSRGRCVDPTCGAEVERHNLLTAESLGTDRDSGHFGYKLETLVTLIEQTPEDDRVLVFVQFDDLYDKVHETLTVYGIPTAVVKGTASQQSAAIEAFQSAKKAKDQKVLLLLATDSSASGANLTSANWAFFVSPLFTDSKEKYKAISTQAIGRIHRYGQGKTARVVHLLTHATKDVEVFEERNDLNVDEVIATQKTQRAEIVNPPRTKKYTFKKAEKKVAKAKAKAKKEEEEAAAESSGEEEGGEEEGDAASSEDEKPAKKPARGAKKAKAPAKGKGRKAAVVDLASDSEVELDSSAAESSEESVLDSEEESEAESTADEAPRKGKGKARDEDDFVISDNDVAAFPLKRTRPRRSAAPETIVVDDSDASDSDDERKSAPKKAKMMAAVKGKGKAVPPPKRKRVIASSDESEAEPAPVKKQPSASTSTAKAKSAASSGQAKKGSLSGLPATRKPRMASFVVEVPSPSKKQSTLMKAFARAREAKAAAEADSSQPRDRGSVPAPDEDAEMREDTPSPTKMASPSPQKKASPSPAAPEQAPSPATAADEKEEASPAPVAVEQREATPPPVAVKQKEASPAPTPAGDKKVEAAPAPVAKGASPSPAASESTESTRPGGDAASTSADDTEQGDDLATALTTPADELMRELGADVDVPDAKAAGEDVEGVGEVEGAAGDDAAMVEA